MSNYLYPATVESNNEGGFIAKFRDVPEAITEAWDLEELKNNARDALISAIDFYIEDRKAFPVGSTVKSFIAQRNAEKRVVNWQFTTSDARIKLRHLYPEL